MKRRRPLKAMKVFYHLTSMKGSVDRAEMHYIIRDFDRKHFEARKRKMMEIAKKVGKGLHPDCLY
ncbi:Tripeptide aminopeptidase [Klebsiella pneumoniae]|uniref:Tripeptide aminopeptidase n=1 Tax=Klebsiella pneumoniae TaxID=573 RepID=A0A3S4KP18_KLEPN|nr:Tripeptide aminopeptidase [Klebsiella pneumoniae]